MECTERKKITKNLANCTPVEFLVQTNKIRKAVCKWVKLTNIFKIRKNKPDGLKEVNPDMTEEEKKTIEEENRPILRKQAMENLDKMLDVALEEHPQETMELIAMACFIKPESVNDYKPSEYMKAVGQMLADEDVIDFFMSLMRLGNAGILNIASE